MGPTSSRTAAYRRFRGGVKECREEGRGAQSSTRDGDASIFCSNSFVVFGKGRALVAPPYTFPALWTIVR